MSTVKTGWLKNNDGEKFAPKTLMSQVMTNEGITLESQLSVELDATLAEAKEYTDAMTSGIASTGVVDSKISAHNISPSAHTDIRGLVSELSTKVNNFLDVDDATADQLSEILEMINNNKGTLDSITSNKVNVSDIIDNLTTSDSKKPLSAKQGLALKTLIDEAKVYVDEFVAEIEGTILHMYKDELGGETVPTIREIAQQEAGKVQTNLNVVDDKVDEHVAKSDIHVTSGNKTNWNTAYTHSQAQHARVDATKVEDSTTNGNIKINGVETNVYTHPADTAAATYRSVTVNTQGHVISGTNPTTLGGYGITDAETKSDASAKLREAKEYTESCVGSLTTDVVSLISAMYGDDANMEEIPPTIREIATDVTSGVAEAVANMVYAESKAYTNAQISELLDGATDQTLNSIRELAEAVKDRATIDALNSIASGKANAEHEHEISDVSGLQDALNKKANSSHGTHVTYSSTDPVMDGAADAGSASTVARSDHKHPTDTSRASKTDFDQLVATVDGKSDAHSHPYAGSSSQGGAANSAVKLATPRTINGVGFDGTAPITITANPTTTTLTGVDLNDYKTPGFYNGGGGNGCTSKPSSVDAFGMIVFKNASGYTCQLLVSGTNNQNVMYVRTHTGGEWTAWEAQYSTANKPTPDEIGASSSGHNHDDRYYTESEINTKVSNLQAGIDSKVTAVSGKGLSTEDYTSAEKTKLGGVESGAQKNTITGVKGNSESSYRTGNVNITKSNIGLGNVDNTSDINKPVSTAQAAAIANSLEEAKTYTNTKTSGMATTTVVDNKISAHNTATSSHNDIRDLISGLTTRLNALADSDDTTLDQLSEIVAYIKSNKSLIDNITTNKVNVADIINNLTTNVTNKPLSAAQGVALKGLIDALQAAVDGKANAEHGHEISDVAELRTELDSKAAAGHTHIYYGVCSTSATTSAKTVTIPDFTLQTGAMIIVKFTNANSVSLPTLNVNGTGAKSICVYGNVSVSTDSTSNGWSAGAVQMFVYDGTNWIRDYWNTKTYSNASLGSGYATCSTAAETTAKTASLANYALTTGGIVSIKFSNDVPAGATLNVNSKGAKAIYHKGASITSGVIKAGDIATFIYSTYYHLIAIDRDSYPKDQTYSSTQIDDKLADMAIMDIEDNASVEIVEDSSNVAVSFSEPATKSLPVSGETLSTLMGKVTKYLKSHDEDMSYSNGSSYSGNEVTLTLNENIKIGDTIKITVGDVDVTVSKTSATTDTGSSGDGGMTMLPMLSVEVIAHALGVTYSTIEVTGEYETYEISDALLVEVNDGSKNIKDLKAEVDNLNTKAHKVGSISSSYTSLLGWCLDNPHASAVYTGLGFTDCILGTDWGSVITLAPRADSGILVFAYRNWDSSVYMRKVYYDGSKWAGNWVDISAKLNTTTITPTDYIDTIHVYRKGDMLQLTLNKTTKDITNLTTTTTIGTLPEGFRPAVATQRIIPVSLSNQMMYLSINTSGSISIRVYGTLTAGTSLYTGITCIAG